MTLIGNPETPNPNSKPLNRGTSSIRTLHILTETTRQSTRIQPVTLLIAIMSLPSPSTSTSTSPSRPAAKIPFVVPDTMKAVVVRKHGTADDKDALSFETNYPVPTPLQKGHVLVKNKYAGLNFIDTYYRSGLYKQTLPFIAGQEGGGTIVQIHQDDDESKESTTTGLQVGDEVVYSTLGTYCEYTAVPASRVIKLETTGRRRRRQKSTTEEEASDITATETAKISMEDAICCLVQGLTAHYLTTDCCSGVVASASITSVEKDSSNNSKDDGRHDDPRPWMLIYSVGSGTCQWAAQLAKLVNSNGGNSYYRVIGTTSKAKGVSDATKTACDELIVLDTVEGRSFADYTSVDIVQKVMEITNGQGANVIVDGVGKSTAQISVKCLARRGLWISFGNASGAVEDFSPRQLTPTSGYLTRPKLGDYVVGDELHRRAEEVFGYVTGGQLDVKVDKIFDLTDVQAGHKYIEGGMTKGKCLFRV
mmetsp:Transcript_13278/g.32415  ORF Transcript_13278/g.32415 Transcript_13278/m.32415 type:complete len:478 (+) Transcript_13278:90-1523(+)